MCGRANVAVESPLSKLPLQLPWSPSLAAVRSMQLLATLETSPKAEAAAFPAGAKETSWSELSWSSMSWLFLHALLQPSLIGRTSSWLRLKMLDLDRLRRLLMALPVRLHECAP